MASGEEDRLRRGAGHGAFFLLALVSCATLSAQGPTEAAARRLAWEQHRRMEQESPFADLVWRAVGPRLQGGRIEAIAVVPGDPSTMGPGRATCGRPRTAD